MMKFHGVVSRVMGEVIDVSNFDRPALRVARGKVSVSLAEIGQTFDLDVLSVDGWSVGQQVVVTVEPQ